MEPTAEQLKEFRLAKRLTLAAMGAALGIPWERYKNYEYGRARFPSDLVAKLTAMGWNAKGREEMPPDVPSTLLRAIARGGVVTLPTLSSVFAGDAQAEETFDDELIETEVPAILLSHDPELKHEYMALVVRGRSMVPRLFPDDVIVVRLTPDVPYGVLTVAKDGERKHFVKVWRHSDARDLDVLESVNGKYTTIDNLVGWTTVGGVIARWRRGVVGETNMEYYSGAWIRA